MAKHTGVGLIVANKDRSRYFVQEKDETYTPKKWANCLSFWGGGIEEY